MRHSGRNPIHLHSVASSEADRLLTVRDVAEYLNVKTSWIYEHIQSGYLPRLGRTRMIRLHETMLATWLDSQLRGFPVDASHDGSHLMTACELMAYTGFSRSWVYEARRSRGLPHYKLGAHLRFSRPLVDAWLAEHPERTHAI